MSETAEAPVVEQTTEQGSASLSAGFNKVRGTPPTESPPADEPKQEAAAEPEAQATEPAAEVEAQADTPAEEPVAWLGLTPSEVKARLASIDDIKTDFEQRERKLLGHMGSLKSELMKSINEKSTPATTAASLKATFKHLREAGYDDVADNLEKDLGEIQSAPAGTVDAAEIAKSIDGRVNEALTAYRKEVETERFTEKHPDWQDLAVTSDFKLWRGLQTPEVQQELATSISARFLSSQFDNFKAWKQKTDPAAQKQKNAARLEGNVTPQGVPSPAHAEPNAKQSLAAGFNKVRRLGG